MNGFCHCRFRVAAVALGFALALPEALAEPERRALLIGCTEYPALSPTIWLKGPVNDVAAFRHVLCSRFGFRDDRITVLAGWPDDAAQRPTRANIETAFRGLAEQAAPGDQIVVFMAGHGSQQPAAPDDETEPDGYDEIFLPADTAGWDLQKGVVSGAVRDDEIGAWLAAVQDKGAHVWAVFDCCHAGTITRGGPPDQVRFRSISAEELIPADAPGGERAPSAATARNAETGGEGAFAVQPPTRDPAATDARLVAMYAVQPNQVALELPIREAGGESHGLFSYTLCKALAESRSPLTYRELIDQVHQRSTRFMGTLCQAPFVEGPELDRPVLGAAAASEWAAPRFLVEGEKPDGRFTLQAGALHGLTVGSILEVYPPAGTENADRPVGCVVVQEPLRPTACAAAPVAYDGNEAPSPDLIEPHSRCKLVLYQLGDRRLRVALQTADTPAADNRARTHPAGTGPAALEQALAQVDAGLLERVESASDAEWLVRVAGGDVLLLPCTGADTNANPGTFTLGAATAPELGPRLCDALTRIARVRNLLALVEDDSASGPEALSVNLEVVRLRGEEEGAVLRYGDNNAERTLCAGERVLFRVTNRSPEPVDVTVLFVDSGFGITSLFPRSARPTHNRLLPGESAPARFLKGTVSADSLGEERVVAIAVAGGNGPLTDFSYLSQPSLYRTRSVAPGNARAAALAELLHAAMYADGATRGFNQDLFSDVAVRSVSWRTVPAE